MTLTIFARFHAAPGCAEALAAAIREVTPQTRAEPGCLGIEAYRSIVDPQLFHIHSHFVDAAAFEIHVGLAHTATFIGKADTLIDELREVSRTQPLDGA
ncbi:MAG: putative Antibiotic biosynthesis monooxygenase [Phenylobacterium sp.]|nr:putative Antibiotic biosynthesis monooxygenase [Phenylobacterium sp.]